jgi:Holliday junction resolvase-like predicted endonuclease
LRSSGRRSGRLPRYRYLTEGALKPTGEITVSTQRAEALGEIDLEIDWSDVLVWVEVKRDMLGPSRPNQLRDYYTALQEKAKQGATSVRNRFRGR